MHTDFVVPLESKIFSKIGIFWKVHLQGTRINCRSTSRINTALDTHEQILKKKIWPQWRSHGNDYRNETCFKVYFHVRTCQNMTWTRSNIPDTFFLLFRQEWLRSAITSELTADKVWRSVKKKHPTFP